LTQVNSARKIHLLNLSMLLFAIHESRPFGEQMDRHLGVELSPFEERRFDGGKHEIMPLVGVRGKDVYVLYSLHGGPVEGANDKLCKLLFLIGTLRDKRAARVTALVPYLAYSRKDRQTKTRDPVATQYVARLFEAARADCVRCLHGGSSISQLLGDDD
jgi:ribose-phosphate pyrophosphokinase